MIIRLIALLAAWFACQTRKILRSKPGRVAVTLYNIVTDTFKLTVTGIVARLPFLIVGAIVVGIFYLGWMYNGRIVLAPGDGGGVLPDNWRIERQLIGYYPQFEAEDGSIITLSHMVTVYHDQFIASYPCSRHSCEIKVAPIGTIFGISAFRVLVLGTVVGFMTLGGVMVIPGVESAFKSIFNFGYRYNRADDDLMHWWYRESFSLRDRSPLTVGLHLGIVLSALPYGNKALVAVLLLSMALDALFHSLEANIESLRKLNEHADNYRDAKRKQLGEWWQSGAYGRKQFAERFKAAAFNLSWPLRKLWAIAMLPFRAIWWVCVQVYQAKKLYNKLYAEYTEVYCAVTADADCGCGDETFTRTTPIEELD